MKFKNIVRDIAVVAFVAGGMANAGVVSVTPGSSDLEQQQGPPDALTLKYSFWSDIDFDDEAGGYDLQSLSLRTPVLGKRGRDFSWGVEFEGEYTYFNSRDQSVVGDHDLYELSLKASFIWNNVKGSKWSPLVILDPSIATDFDSIDSDSFRLTAFAGAFYQQSSNFKWFIGVLYNDLGFEENLFPVAGFSWQPNEQWDLNFLGPRFDATYKYSDDLRLGLFADIYSRSWDVNNAGDEQTLSVFSARAGARVDYRAFQNTWVYLEAGVSFANSVEVHDDNDNELFDDDGDSGVFGNVGLRFEF